MKYLKYFENILPDNLVGYYIQLQYKVKVDDNNDLFYEWANWIDSHIGVITKQSKDQIIIQYENVPTRIRYRFYLDPNTNKYCYNCKLYSLPKCFIGKSPEEVIKKAEENKYNL